MPAPCLSGRPSRRMAGRGTGRWSSVTWRWRAGSRRQVDAAPDLERLAEAPLDIVCFRYRVDGLDPAALDALNRALGARVLEDGRVYVGQTLHRGMVCFRPAIVNWLTTEDDIDLLVAVIRELGASLTPG